MDYQAQSFGVAKYAVSTNKLCGKKRIPMKQQVLQQTVQEYQPRVNCSNRDFHLWQPNIYHGNREPTSRNQIFVVAIQSFTYSNHNIQFGNRVSTYSNQIFVMAKEGSIYSNHIDSVAIEGPTIAMLLMCGNRFYCNHHCRCQCTYCNSLCMWQYVYLTTPSVLQQLLLQHPRWLFMLWLATLHGVATKHHCVAIGKNLSQHQNKPLRKPIATTSMATPPNQIFVLQFCLLQPFFAYCNTFRPLHQG